MSPFKYLYHLRFTLLMTVLLNTNFLFRKTVERVLAHTVKEVKIFYMSLQHNTEGKRESIAWLGCTAVLWYDVVICMMACHWLLAGLRVINMGC